MVLQQLSKYMLTHIEHLHINVVLSIDYEENGFPGAVAAMGYFGGSLKNLKSLDITSMDDGIANRAERPEYLKLWLTIQRALYERIRGQI